MEKNVVFEEIISEDDEKMMNPYEYFQSVKEKVQQMDNEKLTNAYANALKLAETYNRTGQKKGLRKLLFHLESMIKERKVLDAGITKFVYRDDIEEYIENVAKKQVVILDIASYERAIPDEIVDALEKVKDLFDEFYIVCTDYTGKMSRQVQKERREKDPILFGVFLDRDRQAINERFYYIGDWVDEYCDLTLDKMVAEMKNYRQKTAENQGFDTDKNHILYDISSAKIPENIEDLKMQLNGLHLDETKLDDGMMKITLLSGDNDMKGKKSFFSKVKTFLGKK